jgi:hypothetical protein
VRSTLYFNDRLPHNVNPPAVDGLPHGPVTTVATLTFSQFGVPVHVAAPPASAVLPRGEASGGIVIARSSGCRS